jgi:uncharacterized membrane protein
MDATILAGPQLPGAILLIVALVMKYYPPKSINAMYGYRTARSMQNQRNWDEGNRYSANLMAKLGVANIALGVLLIFILPGRLQFVAAIATVLLLIVTVIVLLTATERHLKNLPDETTI